MEGGKPSKEPKKERPAEAPKAAVVPVGQRSTIFLVLSYRYPSDERKPFSLSAFESMLEGTQRWKRKTIDDGGLLPHLDTQVQSGEIVRAFESSGDLSNMFDPRLIWQFHRQPRKGKPGEAVKIGPSVAVKLLGGPTVYALRTGYIFVVLGVRPAEAGLGAFQDTYSSIVRRGWNHLFIETLPRKKAGEGGESKPHPLALMPAAQALEETSLRHWMALLIPGMDPAPPQGGRKSPMGVIALFVKDPLSRGEQYRLRLAHHSDQIEPPPDDDELDHSTSWRPSAQELCLFSPLGVSWVIHALEPQGFLGRFDETLRDRYVYKWILVEHQRLRLIWLSAMCAKMSDNPDARTFRWLRLELLRYTAVYDFGHISSEERHDDFYRAERRALDIEGLFTEVREEINEINDHLSAEREQVLNEVLAFLALVLTPMGLIIGIYQRETLPEGPFTPRLFVSPSAWLALFTCWPFLFVLLSGAVGFFVFTRVLGASAIKRLIERIWHGNSRV